MLKFFCIIGIIVTAFGVKPEAFAYEASAKWNVLIYMQADNDLYPYAIWDLLEIESSVALRNPDIRVRVIADFPGKDGYRLYEMKNKDHSGKLAEAKGPVFKISEVISPFTYIANESKPQLQVLGAVLDETYLNTEFEHNMLVIWGHGEGWSVDREAQFGGVALDDSPKSRISISELAATLGSYNRVYDKKIDILTFDACLMQTMEVAYEFLDITTYLIGSTQIQSFRGLPYTEVLDSMEISSPFELTKKIPELVKKVSGEKFYNDFEFTMSAFNLEEIYFQFVPRFGMALESINNYLTKHPMAKLRLKPMLEKLPKFLGSSRDLGVIVGALEEFFYEKGEVEILELLRQSYAGLRRGVVSNYYGEKYRSGDGGYLMGYFKALGIWYPHNSKNYSSRSSSFAETRFYQSIYAKSWQVFLNKLYKKTLVFGL